jgi:hypothetical protein
VALGVAVAALLLVGAALWPDDDPASRSAAPVADRTAPLAVLRAWDDDRAAAWREGDLRALRRLYLPGSRAGAADRAMLASYLDRGLTVTGIRMQVTAADVRRADEERLVLLVTDRLVGAEVHGGDEAVPLPVDGWSRRRVVLVRTGGRWRVGEVTGQTRADAITAAASGSSNR